MDYKILVLDLDGTLTNTRKEITPSNREALIQTQQQGTRLVLASGRPTYGIAPLADELQMSQFDGYILSYNGGEIIDWKSKEILYANVLPNAVIPQLYECAKRNKLAILTYDKECIVMWSGRTGNRPCVPPDSPGCHGKGDGSQGCGNHWNGTERRQCGQPCADRGGNPLPPDTI